MLLKKNKISTTTVKLACLLNSINHSCNTDDEKLELFKKLSYALEGCYTEDEIEQILNTWENSF
jgi:hypothetical protein